MSQEKKGSVGSGLFWMLFLSVILFWLPVIGPFLAGLVGGKKAGGVGNALSAVFVPLILLGLLLFGLSSAASGAPVFGALLGTGVIVLVLLELGPLLLGAFIGGLLA